MTWNNFSANDDEATTMCFFFSLRSSLLLLRKDKKKEKMLCCLEASDSLDRLVSGRTQFGCFNDAELLRRECRLNETMNESRRERTNNSFKWVKSRSFECVRSPVDDDDDECHYTFSTFKTHWNNIIAHSLFMFRSIVNCGRRKETAKMNWKRLRNSSNSSQNIGVFIGSVCELSHRNWSIGMDILYNITQMPHTPTHTHPYRQTGSVTHTQKWRNVFQMSCAQCIEIQRFAEREIETKPFICCSATLFNVSSSPFSFIPSTVVEFVSRVCVCVCVLANCGDMRNFANSQNRQIYTAMSYIASESLHAKLFYTFL